MYVANISKCSLKVAECRRVAALLLENLTEEQWKDQVINQNILQMRATGASLTIASHLRQRLQCVSQEVIVLIRDGDTNLSTQATFAAALKHSRLLLDFVDLQLREELRLFHPALTMRSWDEFFEGCATRDGGVEKWTALVVTKLRQNVFRMLAEVGLLSDTQTKVIQRISLYPELLTVLECDNESAVIRALRVSAV